MNWIDLIVVLVLILAVVGGWRRGFVVEVCGLAGIVAAIYLAAQYGAAVGGWLGMDPGIAAPGGFAVVLVAVVVVVSVLSRAVRKLFRFAGLGVVDIILGVAVSVAKSLLVLGVLFAAFDSLNEDYTLVSPQTIRSSRTYRPVMRMAGLVYPLLEWVGDRVPLHDEPERGEPRESSDTLQTI